MVFEKLKQLRYHNPSPTKSARQQELLLIFLEPAVIRCTITFADHCGFIKTQTFTCTGFVFNQQYYLLLLFIIPTTWLNLEIILNFHLFSLLCNATTITLEIAVQYIKKCSCSFHAFHTFSELKSQWAKMNPYCLTFLA